MSLEVGSVIDEKYVVRGLLGRGGIGEVYEVEHELTRRRQALKVLQQGWQHDPSLVERFLREAQAASRIGSPHIVEVTDAGRLSSGAPYLVMELLSGQSLADVLGRADRPLPMEYVIDVVSQACVGIEAAHAASIVHRDLKPDNLFISERDGRRFVKVLDFGVSKFQAIEGELGLTQSRVILGTPRYMAPEQMVQSRDVDARADVYSLAVITYELLTGRPPYDAASFPALAALVMKGGAVPVERERSDVPLAVSAVVSAGMAVKAADRPSSAREFGAQLVAAATGVASIGFSKTAMSHAAREPAAATRLPWVLVASLSLAVAFLAGRNSVTPVTSVPPNDVKSDARNELKTEVKPAPVVERPPVVETASAEKTRVAAPPQPAAPVAAAPPRPRPVTNTPRDAGTPPAVSQPTIRVTTLATPLIDASAAPLPPAPQSAPGGPEAPASLVVVWNGPKAVFWRLKEDGVRQVAFEEAVPGKPVPIDIAPGRYKLFASDLSFATMDVTLRAGERRTVTPPFGVLQFQWTGAKTVRWRIKNVENQARSEETKSAESTRIALAPGAYRLEASGNVAFEGIELVVAERKQLEVQPPTGQIHFHWSGSREVTWRARAGERELSYESTKPGQTTVVDVAPGLVEIRPSSGEAFRAFTLEVKAKGVHQVDL